MLGDVSLMAFAAAREAGNSACACSTSSRGQSAHGGSGSAPSIPTYMWNDTAAIGHGISLACSSRERNVRQTSESIADP